MNVYLLYVLLLGWNIHSAVDGLVQCNFFIDDNIAPGNGCYFSHLRYVEMLPFLVYEQQMHYL